MYNLITRDVPARNSLFVTFVRKVTRQILNSKYSIQDRASKTLTACNFAAAGSSPRLALLSQISFRLVLRL